MWWWYAILSAFFASLTAIFAKTGIKGIDSDLATGVRTVIILVMIWMIALYKDSLGGISTFARSNWTFLVLSGITTGLSWLFYFKALQLGKVSLVAPVDKLSMALTVLLAVIYLGEPLTIKVAIGVALILIGTLVLIL